MTDPWAIIGPILGAGYATFLGYLVREHEKDRTAVDNVNDKTIEKVIPALERSTTAGQALGPILERNAAAMGAMTEATDKLVDTTNALLQVLAVWSDRQNRPGPAGRDR